MNDYIIEPSAAQLIADLIPQVLSQKIFTAALDSNASEHAARTLAIDVYKRQPTLATEMGAMQERITSTKTGSITSVQAVYVPADDLTDPCLLYTSRCV